MHSLHDHLLSTVAAGDSIQLRARLAAADPRELARLDWTNIIYAALRPERQDLVDVLVDHGAHAGAAQASRSLLDAIIRDGANATFYLRDDGLAARCRDLARGLARFGASTVGSRRRIERLGWHDVLDAADAYAARQAEADRATRLATLPSRC